MLTLFLAAGVGMTPVVADAEPLDDAETSTLSAADARENGRAAFADGDHDEAIALFEHAYATDPDPTDLYNLGRIHEESGDLHRALDYYEEFVHQPRLSLDERKAATDRIEVLRVAVAPASEPAPSPSEMESSEPARGIEPAARPPADTPRDYPDGRALIASGATLIGVGAAFSIGAGVGFGIAARRASDRIEDLSSGSNPDRLTLSEAEDLEARGRDFETLQITLAVGGGVIAGVGAGLLAAGLIKRKRARSLVVAPTFGPGALGAQARWRF